MASLRHFWSFARRSLLLRNRRAAQQQALEQDVRQAVLQVRAQHRYPSSKRILALLEHRVHPKSAAFTCARQRVLAELGVRGVVSPAAWAAGAMVH